MSEPKTKPYRVKKSKVIFHGGERFEEGAELPLTDEVAEVHADNIELIEPPPKEPPAGKQTKPKPETD
jgi:hypothetical protein